VHLPVLLNEAVDALILRTDGIYVDGTFGCGGHSRLILSRLGKKGRLIAFDKDLDAVKVAAQIDDKRFDIRHSSYVKMREELQVLKVERIDGVLLDLGVSSSQLDEGARGFSFRSEGPLDMRMNTSCGETAAEWLNSVTEPQLEEVIRNYGEERHAKQIARAIVMARARQPISTTIQLAEIVAAVVRTNEYQRGGKQHPATRTFQAIRIHLNQELEELSLTLPQCVDLLNPRGRLVVISFHSLEDRIVKRFMRTEASPDRLPRKLPLRDKEVKDLSKQRLQIIGKALRPSAREIAVNPRARSAVMRVAERIIINE
jgi:16S rRNA (cytosine1402-N4)-methyltransferase